MSTFRTMYVLINTETLITYNSRESTSMGVGRFDQQPQIYC